MKSCLWDQSLDEVASNPYDWPSYRLFLKEASKLLNNLYPILDRDVLKHHRNDRSLRKATWMLLNDALDTLRDAIFLMEHKKHRLVGKMFRHLIEVMDITSYFQTGTTRSQQDIKRWFDDEVIEHRRYRDHLEKTQGKDKAEQSKKDHRNFSRWTHHTYRTLLNSYSLGRDDLLVYDSHSPTMLLALPQTLSQYLWALGSFMKDFLRLMESAGFATAEELRQAQDFTIDAEEKTSQQADSPVKIRS